MDDEGVYESIADQHCIDVINDFDEKAEREYVLHQVTESAWLDTKNTTKEQFIDLVEAVFSGKKVVKKEVK
jgi:hypothetical protein